MEGAVGAGDDSRQPPNELCPRPLLTLILISLMKKLPKKYLYSIIALAILIPVIVGAVIALQDTDQETTPQQEQQQSVKINYKEDGTIDTKTYRKADGSVERIEDYQRELYEEGDGQILYSVFPLRADGKMLRERVELYEADNKTLKRTEYYQYNENERVERITYYRIDKENGTLEKIEYINTDGAVERTELYDENGNLTSTT